VVGRIAWLRSVGNLKNTELASVPQRRARKNRRRMLPRIQCHPNQSGTYNKGYGRFPFHWTRAEVPNDLKVSDRRIGARHLPVGWKGGGGLPQVP
jgi:hypothetical protein